MLKRKVLLLLVMILILYPLQQQGDSHVLATETEQRTYKAITYNIHSGKDSNDVSSINRIIDLLREEQADFIALQEVDRRRLSSGVQDQISILAEQLRMDYAYSPALQTGIAQYGNAILSRYPILATGTLPLTGGKEDRVLLWAQVYTEAGSLYITSVHLDTERSSRSKHFVEIQQYLETTLADAPVLLMGDLNTLYDHPDLMQLQLQSTGKYRAYEIPTFYHTKAGRSIQIDYIFGRGIVEERYYTLKSDASDHLPLVLTFTIGKLPYIDIPLHLAFTTHSIGVEV